MPLTELDRKILSRACGLCWHEIDYDADDGRYFCRICGEIPEYPHTKLNPNFDSPDDWELVRQRVCSVPGFHWYIGMFGGLSIWIVKTPEQCCQFVCNWIKSRPDLFPWVGEMEGKDRKHEASYWR